jgi:hypothetical protein
MIRPSKITGLATAGGGNSDEFMEMSRGVWGNTRRVCGDEDLGRGKGLSASQAACLTPFNEPGVYTAS